MRYLRIAPAFLVALLASACAETAGPTPPGAPARMDVLGGDGQVDTVGHELPVALAVRVLDGQGRPVPDLTVNFRVVAGGGSVFAGAAETDANGEARERWTLGTVAGDSQRLEVRAVHPSTGEKQVFAVFTAVAIPDSPSQIEPVGPTSRTGAAGQPLADSLAVRLRDRYGNVTPGVQVAWTTADGTLSPTLGSTGADGVARSQWVLGTQTDSAQQASATVGALSVQFTAIAAIPATAILRRVSGDNQVGTVGQPLADSLVVRLQLADGRPLPGVQITWGADPNGFATPAVSRTDANGYASTRWTLATGSGTQTLYAFAPGRNTRFLATANAASPVAILKYRGDGQTALPGNRVAVDPAVRLVDQYGNGVRGRFVTWTVTGGGGSVTRAGTVTGEGGIASTGWTLGPAGPQSLRAASGSLAPVTFTASSVPPNTVAPQTMTLRTGDSDSARVNYYQDATTPSVWTSLDSTVAFVARTTTRTAVVLGKKPGSTGIVVRVGTFYDTLQVTVLPLTESFTTFSIGPSITCALTTGGSAYCWGHRMAGTIAPVEEMGRNEAPVRYTGPLGLTWIHLNEPYNGTDEAGACAGNAAGDVYCWGRRPVVSMRQDSFPGLLPGGYDWRKVEFDRLHACGIRFDNSMHCWGSPRYGSGGNGFPGAQWTDVTVGRFHSCGIKTDGTAWCWGLDEFGQLGATVPPDQLCLVDDYEFPCTSTPVPVEGGRTYTMIDASDVRTCAIETGGTAWCWGGSTPTGVPVQVPDVQFTSIEVGPGTRVCGVGEDGRAYCWNFGQAPGTPVSTTLTFRHVEPFYGGACGITTSNVIYCWGSNGGGELGSGDSVNRAAPTRVVGQP